MTSSATLALMTPSLLKVIAEAKARNDVIAKATPDEKPPFGDGIPYQSFPDAAPGCEAGEVVEKPGRTEAEVTYRFPDTPNADWTDRLKLVPEGDKLLVDDILFANVANGEPDQGSSPRPLQRLRPVGSRNGQSGSGRGVARRPRRERASRRGRGVRCRWQAAGRDRRHRAPVFPRSAVKSIQALPLVESGAADAFGFDDRKLALACASHRGEPAHAELAAAMLAAGRPRRERA